MHKTLIMYAVPTLAINVGAASLVSGISDRSDQPWSISNRIYSEYTSCSHDVYCPAHPVYPFRVSRWKLIHLVEPEVAHHLPDGVKTYEEMGISLVPRRDSYYNFYYRANFPSKYSEARKGLLSPDFDYVGNNQPILVPGIPADPASSRHIPHLGPEDPRAFKNPSGDTMLIYSRADSQGIRAMYLFNTVMMTEVRLDNFGLKTQKNWTPLTYTSPRDLILFYSMQPIELVRCDVYSGTCVFTAKTNQSFFQRGVTLRGGTPFYHYRDNYYYSFARTVQKPLQHGRSVYRLVFMLVDFDKDTLSLTPAFVSSPFDYYTIPQMAVDDHLSPSDDAFKYILPYSAIIKGSDMIVTVNVNDTQNVALTMSGVTTSIDEIIRQYEKVHCETRFTTLGWDGVMTSSLVELATCKEKLKAMWRVATDSFLWDNSHACLYGPTLTVTDKLSSLKGELPYKLFNEATESIFSLEVERLCDEKRSLFSNLLNVTDSEKREICSNPGGFEFFCNKRKDCWTSSQCREVVFSIKAVRMLQLTRPTEVYASVPDNLRNYYEMAASIIPVEGGFKTFWRAYREPLFSSIEQDMLTSYFSTIQSAHKSLLDIPLGTPAGQPLRDGWKNLGPEDSRVFANPSGETMLIYNRRNYKTRNAHSYIYNTVTRREVELTIRDINVEKNWTPIKYLNDKQLLLARYLDPLEIITCDVMIGECVTVSKGHTTLARGEYLRGGSPFYHFKDNYYYSFARYSNGLCGDKSRTYRPVFMVIYVDGLDVKMVYTSPPLSFVDAAIRQVHPDFTSRDFCTFAFVLPYSAIYDVEADVMHVTMNLKDSENILVSLGSVNSAIDEIVTRHKSTGQTCIFACFSDALEEQRNRKITAVRESDDTMNPFRFITEAKKVFHEVGKAATRQTAHLRGTWW